MFTRILINKLSIEAPSILNIKSKSIVFYVDEMFVELSEMEEVPHKPKIIADLTAKKSSVKYGFLDRVVDSISFQINKINVAVRTLGKAKTNKLGPWTPPVLFIEMLGSRVYCTNHNSVECDLEDCFRIRPTKRPMLFLYKKLEVKSLSLHLVNPECWSAVADALIANGKLSMSALSSKIPAAVARGYLFHTIVSNTPFEIQVSMRKRLDNHRLLGLEISFVWDTLHLTFRQNVFTEFMQFVMGVSYALWRKEAVKEVYGLDPHGEQDGTVGSTASIAPATQSASSHSAYAKRLARDFFGEAELAQINAIEAEIEATSPALLDSDWQRSTLNSDEDPPHLRLAIVLQANEIKVTFPLDGIKRPPFPSSFGTSSDWDGTCGPPSQGVIVTLKSVVHRFSRIRNTL
jgi:hypothetical protein